MTSVDPATTSSSIGASNTAWPPESISIQTKRIIDECELLEMSSAMGAGGASASASGLQQIAAVEMAALLYQGEYVHARHLWRRTTHSSSSTSMTTPVIPLLQDWWNVGKGMMCNDGSTIWQSLTKIVQDYPEPFKTYAQEVGTSYRIRMLTSLSLVTLDSPSSTSSSSAGPTISLTDHAVQSIHWSLLNFSTEQECKDFCSTFYQQLLTAFLMKSKGPMMKSIMPSSGSATSNGNSMSLTQVVSYLESSSKKGRI
mmetsp:Transcript_21852/g.51549  ORF Transcript_21852/g.51549 Transcript_21852/m.51549 type:complete len:256 (-) Transcript_21852:298-1065(-)